MDTHKQMPWHTKKLEEVYQVVNTSEKGLSDTEAAEKDSNKMEKMNFEPNRPKHCFKC